MTVAGVSIARRGVACGHTVATRHSKKTRAGIAVQGSSFGPEASVVPLSGGSRGLDIGVSVRLDPFGSQVASETRRNVAGCARTAVPATAVALRPRHVPCHELRHRTEPERDFGLPGWRTARAVTSLDPWCSHWNGCWPIVLVAPLRSTRQARCRKGPSRGRSYTVGWQTHP